MRTLHADLLAAQQSGYPTGGVQPYIPLVFTSSITTYDYSFNPTLTTGRPLRLEHHEEPWDDYATILLRNNDLAVPDLRGFYVDIGYGAQTASGLRYSSAPRLWVKQQYANIVVGDLIMTLILGGKMRVLREQRIKIGTAPTYRAEGSQLTGKTIYGILEYLIETTLSAQTGFTFTLDALGSQDDGVINLFIPQPTNTDVDGNLVGFRPQPGDTYATFIQRLMQFTKCKLKSSSGFSFKIVYPQDTDAVNERYYSSSADGHPFTDYTLNKFLLNPNWISVYGGYRVSETTPPVETWDYVGNAYDPQSFTPGDHIFFGNYMPLWASWTAGKEDVAINTQPVAQFIAEALLQQAKEQTFGGRAVIPHDCGIELYDNAVFFNTRGT